MANNGTHVFLAGGFRGVAPGTAQTNVSVYSIVTNTWSSLPSIPVATAAASLAYYNGELFFFGGLTDADTPTNGTYVLNLTAVHASPSSPAANWTALSSALPLARSHAAALVLSVQSPFVLIPGGAIGNSSVPVDLNTSLAFNLTTLQFNSDIASMPSNRSHYGSDVANASGCCPVRALVLGGRDISVPRVLDTIIEYSPDENIWYAS